MSALIIKVSKYGSLWGMCVMFFPCFTNTLKVFKKASVMDRMNFCAWISSNSGSNTL